MATFYLIDHEGVIRERWIDVVPTSAELDTGADALVEVALYDASAP